MTFRQSILKTIYPAVMGVSNLLGLKVSVNKNKENIQPVQSFYDLKFADNSGKEFYMSRFKGKKVLLVNTASDCGFTAQLGELQQLQNLYKNNLVVIGFPSNDFKNQEQGTDNEIETFCKVNYGVDFLLAKKTGVIKNPLQHDVFKWLTFSNKNGWNEEEPGWNFTKYLVNEQGVLTHSFSSSVSPLSKKIKQHCN